MDDKVIIIDEENELTPEEIEEKERNERLGRLSKKKKYNSVKLSIVFRSIALLGLFGIMLGMFTESAAVLTGSLIVTGASALISYFFF